jgi:hypothetical protein
VADVLKGTPAVGPVSISPLDWICPLLAIDADAFNHGGPHQSGIDFDIAVAGADGNPVYAPVREQGALALGMRQGQGSVAEKQRQSVPVIERIVDGLRQLRRKVLPRRSRQADCRVLRERRAQQPHREGIRCLPIFNGASSPR